MLKNIINDALKRTGEGDESNKDVQNKDDEKIREVLAEVGPAPEGQQAQQAPGELRPEARPEPKMAAQQDAGVLRPEGGQSAGAQAQQPRPSPQEPFHPPQYVPRQPTPEGDEEEEIRRVLAGLRTVIKIVGTGGAGSNTVNRIAEEGIYGADLIALNTDAQHLLHIQAPNKILLGRHTTRGLGAGARPDIGEQATLEAEEEVRRKLSHSDIVFLTCGLGGGTGTGSAPVVARIAKEMGILTISVVTYPFKGEGVARQQNSDWGLERLQEYSDTVIVIPNDKLLELVPRLPLNKAFKVADEILMRAIKGLVELVTKVGLVNLDFNDLKTIMKGGGVAMIGLGECEEHENANEAVQEAINSPLLEVDVSEAKGALVSVVGGERMTVRDAESVAEEIQKRISSNARIIWGARIDPTLGDGLRVMIVLTGVKSKQILGKTQRIGGKGGKRLGIEFVR